jgi:hypothetical protein
VRLLFRIPVIIFAFAIACGAAAIIFTVGMLTPDWHDFVALAQTGYLTAIVSLNAYLIAGITLIPVLLIILVAEGFGWRSVLFYAAAGLALGLFFHYGWVDRPVSSGSFFSREREILAAVGIAGGLVYWALAGRNAGKWRDTIATPR